MKYRHNERAEKREIDGNQVMSITLIVFTTTSASGTRPRFDLKILSSSFSFIALYICVTNFSFIGC